MILHDVFNDNEKEIIVERTDFNILIRPEGCNDNTSQPNKGHPIAIEYRDNVPYIVIWSDINKADPTHEISLEQALEANRK